MAIPEGVCWRGKAWVSPGLGIFLGHAGSHVNRPIFRRYLQASPAVFGR